MVGSDVVTHGDPGECAKAIRGARHVLVVCHIDPDGDAIGSMLGVGWFLRALNIPHVLACESPVPTNMAFLPHTEPVVSRCLAEDIDLVVALDCSSYDRLGQVYPENEMSKLPLINIDHHVSNTLFGAVNWVDSRAAATAEMIYFLAAPLGVEVSREAAICLLAGIITDTWGFRTPSTTERTLEVALETVRAGASMAEIVSETIDSRSFSSLCLWSRVVGRAILDDGVIWAEISRDDFHACGAGQNGKNGLINFLLSAREAKVAVLLTEAEGRVIDVSLRSVPGVAVSDTAVQLGGGGHPQAAGCTLNTSLSEARVRVRDALARSLEQQGITWLGAKLKK